MVTASYRTRQVFSSTSSCVSFWAFAVSAPSSAATS